MSTNCITYYLDENMNPSEIFEGYLKEGKPMDEALEVYVTSMLDTINARFSKTDQPLDLKDFVSKLESRHTTIKQKSKSKFIGVTNFLKKHLTGEFDENLIKKRAKYNLLSQKLLTKLINEKFEFKIKVGEGSTATEKSLLSILRTILRSDFYNKLTAGDSISSAEFMRNIFNNKVQFYKLMSELENVTPSKELNSSTFTLENTTFDDFEDQFIALKNFLETLAPSNPDIQKEYDEIKKGYDSDAEKGTKYHDYLEKLNKEFAEEYEKLKKEGKLDTLIIQSFIKSRKKYTIPPGFYAAAEQNLRELFDELKNGYVVMPELKLSFDSLLKLDKDIYESGMVGIADLVLYNPTTNKFKIKDYKTKTNRFNKDIYINLRTQDGFKNAKLNAATNPTQLAKVNLQLSTYALLFKKALEENGIYNAELEGLNIIILKDNGDDKSPNYEYDNIKGTDMVKEVSEILNLPYSTNIANNLDPTKSLNSPHKITKKIIGVEYEAEKSLDERVKDEFLNKAHLRIGSNGKRYYIGDDGQFKYYKNQAESDEGNKARELEFRAYWSDKANASTKVTIEAENWYTNMDSNSFSSFDKAQYKNIFGIKNRDTHKLRRANTLPGYGHLSPNILCLKNEKNGAISLIKLNSSKERINDLNKLLTGEDGRKKNLLHRFGNENQLARKYRLSDDLKFVQDDADVLELGILASQMIGDKNLKNEGFKSVEEVRSAVFSRNSKTGKVANPSVLTGKDLDRYIHNGIFKMLASDKEIYDNLGENLKNRIDEVLKNPRNNNLAQDKFSRLQEVLMHIINLDNASYYGLSTANQDYFKNLYDKLNEGDPGPLLNKLRNIDAASMQATIKHLIDISDKVNKRLSLSYNQGNLNTEEQYFLRILNTAVTDLVAAGINVHSYSLKSSGDNKFRSMSHIGNQVIQALDSIKKRNDLNISREHNEFKNRAKAITKALIKEKTGGLEKATTRDLNIIFKNLYKVNPNKPLKVGDDGKDLYILRDPNDKNDGLPPLSKAETDYINFFNESIDKYYENLLSPEAYANFKKNWTPGQIPLRAASLDNKITRMENYVDKAKAAIKGSQHSTYKQDSTNYLEYQIFEVADYEAEAKGEKIQASGSRRTRLGLSDDGTVTTIKEPFETNLDVIINAVVSDSLTAKHHKETMVVWNGLNYINTLNSQEFFRNGSKETQELLNSYLNYVLLNKQKEESSIAKGIDRVQQIATFQALGYSPKQILMELATSGFGSVSTLMVQTMNSFSKSKDAQMVNPISWAKAGKEILFDMMRSGYTRSEHLAKSFALIRSDPQRMKGEEHIETKKGFIFKRSNAFKPNNIFAEEATLQMFMAHLDHLGILDSYVQDGDTFTYKPHLDKRFNKIFDSNKKLISSDKLDDEGKKQLSLYMSIYNDLISDGYEIDDINNIPFPMAANDVEAVKTFIAGAYGSLDQRSKIMAQEIFLGRLFFKFKNWMIIKKDNWWSKGDYKKAFGKRITVQNENGEYETIFESQWHEGIMQTLGHMFGGGVANIMNGQTWSELNDIQKTNIRKAIADLILVATTLGLLSALRNNEFFKTPQGKVLHKILANSVSDLNIIQMSGALIENGPFAVGAYMMRVVKALTNLLTLQPEVDDLKAFGGLASSIIDVSKD